MAAKNTDGQTRGRRLRIWLARSVAGLFVGVVAAAAILLAIDLGWQRDRLVAIGISIAQDSLGLEISVGDTTGRLSQGIVLRDVRLGDRAEPFLEFDALHVDWDVRSILSTSQQSIRSIRLEGWSLRLRRTSEGQWRDLDDVIARLAADEVEGSEESESRPPLLLRQIEVGEGELNLIVEAREKALAPRQAIFVASGEIHGLRLDPEKPPSIEKGRLEAKLVESRSGIPDFDRSVEATIDLAAAGRRIESLVVRLDATGIRADLRAAGRPDALEDLAIEVDAQDLAPLGGWVQAAVPWAGQLVGRADLSGPIDGLVGTAHFEARNLFIDDVRTDELDLDLDLKEPISEALTNPMEIVAELRLHARQFDPGKHSLDWLPPGKSDFEFNGGLSGGKLDLREGKLLVAGLALTAKGTLTREQIEGLDLRFDIADVEPWIKAQRSNVAIRGPLRGEATLTGPVGNPRGRVLLHSDGLSFRDREVESVDLTLERKIDGPVLLEAMIGGSTNPRLETEVLIDLDRERMDFDVAADAETLVVFFDQAPPIRGQVVAKGFLERGKEGPIFELDFRSEKTVVESIAIGQVEILGKSVDGKVIEISRIESEGEAGKLSLVRPIAIRIDRLGAWELDRGDFQITLAPDGLLPGTLSIVARGTNSNFESVDVSIDALPMASVSRFLSDQPPLGGQVKGHASWGVSRVVGWTGGELEWTDPSVGSIQIDQVLLEWAGRPEAIDLELHTRVAERSPLDIRGQIMIPDFEATLSEILSVERLSFQAEMDQFDVSVLNALSTGWSRAVSGRVSGSLRVAPGPGGPSLTGEAKISDGGFTVPILRQRFAPIDGTFRLDNRSLIVDGLRIGKADASATLDGTILFAEDRSPEIDGEIRFDHFPFARNRAARMDVLGSVRFAGTLERPVVKGELSVDDARIGVPAADDPILKEIRIATRSSNGSLVEPDQDTRGSLDDADIDVLFTVPGSTRIRGQGANLFVEGKAHADKRAAEPLRIKGEARVVNGTYTFQGRTFQVRRGRVLLTGDERLDPVLDVEARLPISDITAIIELSGRLSAPIVRLTSDPPLSDQDVLAYLLFGRPAEQVTAAGDSNFGAAAARLVAGVAETELREVLGDAMPVDSIEIGADDAGNTSELGFGKYLSSNLFFRYVHILGDEPADRVGVEYRLNDMFSVGSSVSTTGDAGLDLILRRDF